jgi:hypothetical protein
MSGRYPIIRHRELGLLFWWKILRRRPPAAGPDQALVYLISGHCADYVEGTPEGPSAGVLAVTIVDVRRDVPIRAECHVAAGESWWEFPVMVTFHCTVVSPATVARSRRTDAIRSIDSYLQGILNAVTMGSALLARDERSLQRTLTEALQRRLAITPIPGVQVVVGRLDVKPACRTDPGDA